MTDKKQLFSSFDQLKSDKKLKNVMKKGGNCQLQLWILEICEEKRVSKRLLYSWVIPADYCDGKWYKADIETKWSPNTSAYKVNLKKFTLYSNGESIYFLILDLLKGNSISKACENLNLTKPPKEVSEFKLENTYVVRPPVFLETKSMTLLYKENIRPIQSPSRDVTCVSASLFQLQKMNIWGKSELNSKPIESADELARFCINALINETGFKFDGRDSSRLGNIEWIATPLLDPEESPIDFSMVNENVSNQNNKFDLSAKSCKEIEVYLKSGLDLPNEKLLIRCRLRNCHEIMLDQVKLVDIKTAEQGLRFSANQQVNQVQLTVWIANSNDGEWEMWYEQDTPLTREMNMEMGMIGLRGNVELSTIQEWRNSKKIKDRVQHYERVKQTTYQYSSIGGYVRDPWAPSTLEVSNYVNRLFPAKSKGEFFPKGWGDDAPSALSFAEWFKSITNNADHKLVTIVDPYFDTVGLELIAHSPTTNSSFEVITCTQVKSNDDKVETKINEIDLQENVPDPERATRIKKGCENLRLILSRLQLKILDIRGNQKGKGSYFHDRYILIYDNDGNISEGYHLSNSLQAATKFDPLLVTPIPIDILTEVASYVDMLRNARPPIINYASTIQIYPEMVVNNDVSECSVTSNNDNELLKRLSKTSLFLAELLQDPEITSTDIESVKQKLLDRNLIDPESLQFIVGDEKSLYKALNTFSEKLLYKDNRAFFLLWESFLYWLTNVIDAEKYLYKVCDNGNIRLGERIKFYLLTEYDLNIERVNGSQEITVLQWNSLLNCNFKESLYHAYLLLDGHYANRLYGNYNLKYATKAILYLSPLIIVNVLEELYENQGKQKEETFIKRAYLLDELIIHLLSSMSTNDLIDSLLLTKVPFLRGLGSQAKWFQISDVESLSSLTLYNDLTKLNKNERILAYSEWIYHLRVKVNRMGAESQEIKDVRISIYQKIRENWPNNLSKADAMVVLRRLCGPSVGGWSKDIYHDLMLYLVQDNNMTSDEAILFWINLFLEKVEGDKDNNISLYAPRDILFIELCANILTDLSKESWAEKIKQIQKLINKCNRVIRTPFEKSKNINNWNKVKKQGMLLKVFLELAYNATDNKKSDITEVLNRMDNKLKN
ncbi:VPA1262 family protein [Bacillus cereus group sp. RP32]|uniref:VPA1262 family protein n=1 Tax=Bacillus cereus group sp. RP32 TaxID=3040258 RepID=UPI0033990341